MGKILVVDDSNLMVSVIKNFIGKGGVEHEIVEAHSGEEAIQKYKDENPDLVFMDIKMPGMDGISAMEKIKEIDSSAKVAMCTSLKEAEQEQRARNAGCVAYITKPFNSQDIIDTVKQNIP